MAVASTNHLAYGQSLTHPAKAVNRITSEKHASVSGGAERLLWKLPLYRIVQLSHLHLIICLCLNRVFFCCDAECLEFIEQKKLHYYK